MVRILKWFAIPSSSTIVFTSHASKVMLKVLQARLQQYMNKNSQMYKLGLQKAEEPGSKLPTFIGS